MNLSLLNSLCYTAGWFWCVLCGIYGQPLVAASGGVVLIIFQLYYAKNKDRIIYIQDVLLVIFSLPLGAMQEMLFIQTNLVRYVNSNNCLPPIWIILLYPQFSLLLNHSLKLIKKSYIISFLFGFLGAPLSYMAGISLGGLSFLHPLSETWMWIGFSWGIFLCILANIANRIASSTRQLE